MIVVVLVYPELKSTRITDVIILVFLLLLWGLAVSLFFKRWGQTLVRYDSPQSNEMMFPGKIRNLIPYQPYQQPTYMTEISQQIERIQSENKTKISSGELCSRCKSKVSSTCSMYAKEQGNLTIPCV